MKTHLRLGTALVLGALNASVSSASAANPSASDARAATSALCSDDAVTCSVQGPSTWAEGATHSVAVTGKKNTTVTLRAHRLVVTTGVPVWIAHGDPVEVTTGRRGYGDADLTLPALAADTPGGAVLIAVDGADLSDLTSTLGAWTTLTSRTPALLGDAWSEKKPVGEEIAQRVEGALDGTAFDVELLDHSGWTSIGTSTSRACRTAHSNHASHPNDVSHSAPATCDVTYRVPRGLPSRAHEARLVNLATGTPVGNWTIVPSDAPEPQARVQASTAFAGTADLSSAVAGATVQTNGSTITAVRRPRSANLELPEGAEVAEAATPETHSHPAELARAVGVGGALAAALASVVMLRRRKA